MQNNQTTAVNAAVIIMGGYSLPASVAFGALVGASLFVLHPNNYKPVHKAWLFAVSFFTGIFAGEGMVQFRLGAALALPHSARRSGRPRSQ